MRKKVDARVRTLIENGVKSRHRSFILLVGDRGRDQIVSLHYMLSKAAVKRRPSVLWCYKKELGFSSHRKKRMRQIQKKIQRGLLDPDASDPFELFISSTEIRYCYYNETHKVLGNTYGMLVLQDFEAITPNLLARTVETVEGGGIVVLLLRTMASLKQLYTLSMDVHSRFRTESHQDVVARFNERFLLSLAVNPMCLALDDELNVLSLSSLARKITPLPGASDERAQDPELERLVSELADTQPDGSLVAKARTIDQARAVMTFLEAISAKTLRNTVALTAARGRGKSAALGLAMAGAIAYGYSNIFVTSPSPENLKTLFEFVFKGFDALDYHEHMDYQLVQSSNPAFNKAIVRVNVFRTHRQTIQYVQPHDHRFLAQAELVVIDEAAAIPLPTVRNLLGPYLVFMASTINGYEGTGRSLSLKLLQQLRQQSKGTAAAATTTSSAAGGGAATALGRVLREVKLEEPIRYAAGDPVERWLHQLLCLDANITPDPSPTLPMPDACQLYYVNRDTLFSFHRASEAFLQQMMALYVSSHYKNTPNDLQLMSDAPAHHLFVLLGPVRETDTALPQVLCVLQVCLEGAISKQSVMRGLSRGYRADGDLIPWTVSQQFQDQDFAGLSGVRVVRIATHPDYARRGYGRRALDQLRDYYLGRLTDLDDVASQGAEGAADAAGRAVRKQQRKLVKQRAAEAAEAAAAPPGALLTESLVPRKNLPPLLLKLGERTPETVHWLGVSFGLTQGLYDFWSKAAYRPVYLRQTANELTGEHTCIMLQALQGTDPSIKTADAWLDAFVTDFRRRFLALLGYQFSAMQPALALSILGTDGVVSTGGPDAPTSDNAISLAELQQHVTVYDLKRLRSYSRNLVDYHVIVDLLPALARLLYQRRLPVTLSYSQAAILVGLGLQHKTVDAMERDLNLPGTQILGLFLKAIKRIEAWVAAQFAAEEEAAIAPAAAMRKDDARFQALDQSLDQELDEGAAQVSAELEQQQRELLAGDLSEFAIKGSAGDWDEALSGAPGSSVSVKTGSGARKRKPGYEQHAAAGSASGKKKRKKTVSH